MKVALEIAKRAQHRDSHVFMSLEIVQVYLRSADWVYKGNLQKQMSDKNFPETFQNVANLFT